nr:DUF2062 domain-containing protein [Desulforamulus aquiferis]
MTAADAGSILKVKTRQGLFFGGVQVARYFRHVICRCKEAWQQLLDLPEAPQYVAKGIALGFAFGFLPIPIINIPLSYLVAKSFVCMQLLQL